MAQLTISISLDNESLSGDTAGGKQELMDLLHVVGRKLVHGAEGGKIMDSNGKTVGHFAITGQ